VVMHRIAIALALALSLSSTGCASGGQHRGSGTFMLVSVGVAAGALLLGSLASGGEDPCSPPGAGCLSPSNMPPPYQTPEL